MKNAGFLILAALLFFGAFRYGIHPERIKAENPEHPIGNSPLAMIRVLGLLMVVLGALLVYAFCRSL